MIPEYSWRVYDELVQLLASGTAYASRLQDFEQRKRNCDVPAMLSFLAEIGLVTEELTPTLTRTGMDYFIAKHARNDSKSARSILRAALQRHPETVQLCQSLYGYSSLNASNVRQLLAAVCHPEDDELSVTPFLLVLNEADIVKFSTKTKSVRIMWQPDAEEHPPEHSFLSSRTPYSNVKRLRQILGSLRGSIYWIDKHFDRKAFDAISETADSANWASVVIISTDCNMTATARSDFDRLRSELSDRGISLEWRICNRRFASTFHDRWLIGDNAAYNIPPVNTIYKGQDAEIHKTESPPDPTEYIRGSTPV